jgi:NAD(P)-dependent dehydrogenase (short-subunit alcohol dehydrogenase family)
VSTSKIDLLTGKSAVVTGASRGIGFAIAEALSKLGCGVVLTSRNLASAQAVAANLKNASAPVVPIACDVKDETSIKRLFQTVREQFGSLSFLINNAGIYGPAYSVENAPVDGFREAIETNLIGPFLCTKYAVPLMRKGSVIVNNLSVAAYQVFPKSAAYIASKQGLLGLTNASREDLRPRGIRVVALVPGATDTEIWNQFWPEAPRDKMMRPGDVAHSVVTALLMPPETSMDEIRIMPAAGAL